MMQRTALIRLALSALALVAVACNPLPSRPEHAATDFVVADERLAGELRAAAEDWARAGLVVAEYVTINQRLDGVPLREQPRTRLPAMCGGEGTPDGCADFYQDRFEGFWIASDLSPERRAVVLRHELIHFLVPDAEHLSNDESAIFSVNGTSTTITTADMLEMARHTDVTTPVTH
jgi:hypothetical protein